MTRWTLSYDSFDPQQEALREALCALGNGYIVTRGAAAECPAGEIHYPGTYLACGYNRLKTEIAGRTIENEDLVNLPNWLPLTFRIEGGQWFNPLSVEILDYRQELDMKHGTLLRTIRFRDGDGRETTMRNRRLVHMGNPHVAAQETTLQSENWSGEAELVSGIDGSVVNAGVKRYQQLSNKHLRTLELRQFERNCILLKAQTTQSELAVAIAARTSAFRNGEACDEFEEATVKDETIAQTLRVPLSEGDVLRVEKVVTIFTSRDNAISECGLRAQVELSRQPSFEELLERHEMSWRQLWRSFDVELDLDRNEQDERWMNSTLRLHLFHLLQTVSPHTMDMDVGVPSRGWHGEAYRGHIFWDELFIFPLLNLRLPESTRALLLYRYRRLDEARAQAREAGYRGAMYPWQSGSTGREESQRVHLNPRSGRWNPDDSRLQRHVGSAIAYNIWHYFQVTGDYEFLSAFGAEMFLEIARYWASVSTYNSALDRYEICGVMGPDEYHERYPGAEEPGLKNNAYTNVMAVWVFCRAGDLLHVLSPRRVEELRETLQLGDEEIAHWDELSRKMRIAFHGDGIISQFEGYDELAEFDWDGYREKYDNIQRLDRILEAEGDSPNFYKASKQADVLMLLYLFSAEELEELFNRLGYRFPADTIPKNVSYYLRRTSHGSTLSRVVNSWVLARSDRPASWDLFKLALSSDVSDIQGGTTPEGIHLGAMAGTVDLLQRGYSGICAREGVLWFNPCLPTEIKQLRMRIRYRLQDLDVEISQEALSVHVVPGGDTSVRIGYLDEALEAQPGKTLRFQIAGKGCGDESASSAQEFPDIAKIQPLDGKLGRAR